MLPRSKVPFCAAGIRYPCGSQTGPCCFPSLSIQITPSHASNPPALYRWNLLIVGIGPPPGLEFTSAQTEIAAQIDAPGLSRGPQSAPPAAEGHIHSTT